MVMAPSATSIITEYAPVTLTTTLPETSTVTEYNNYGDAQQTSKRLVGQALKGRVAGIDENTCEAGEEDAFFVADVGEVYRQHMRWKANLKRVKPHYGRFTVPRAWQRMDANFHSG